MSLFNSNCCGMLALVLIVHWLVGLGAFGQVLVSSFGFLFGIAYDLVLYLLAYVLIMLSSVFQYLSGFFYYIWTVLAVIANGVYVVAIFYLFQPQNRGRHAKTPQNFFIALFVSIIIPQLVNYIILNDNIRIYVALPFNIALFLNFLDLKDDVIQNAQKFEKIVINLVLSVIIVGIIF